MRRQGGYMWTAPAAACALLLIGCGGSDQREADGGSGEPEVVTAADSVLRISTEEVRRRVANHVGSSGDFVIVTDPATRKQHRVSFVRVHEEVETTAGGRRSVCVDFRGSDGTIFVVEYWLGASRGRVAVEDRLLHRVGEVHVAEDSVVERLNAAPGGG